MTKKFNWNIASVLVVSVFAIFAVLIFFNNFHSTGYYIKSGTIYNCSNCSDCNAAIIDASAGDTVYLNANNNNVTLSGDCIKIISKSSITLDCLGNLISSNLSSNGGGILFNNSNNITIRNCKISGFLYGIFLGNNSKNLTIRDTESYNNVYGIFFWLMNDSTLWNVTARDNSQSGIYLGYSQNNNLTNITSTNNVYGVYFSASKNNTLKNSYIQSNSIGSYFSSSINNSIYNNYFNNTGNSVGGDINFFNITKSNTTTNIIGGNYTGGNFWAIPNGTGFSQRCTNDSDGDFICDYPYNISGIVFDYLPLIYNIYTTPCVENWSCTNWTSCSGGSQTRTCTDANSCGTVASRPTLSQSCSTNTTNPNYQETADSITCTGNWDSQNPCNNTYDANWNTYGNWTQASQGFVFLNYTRPANFGWAVWQVKDYGGMVNLTIPSSCINTTNLLGRLILKAITQPLNSIWQCYGFTSIQGGGYTESWVTLRNYTYGGHIYEEAVIWIPSSTSTSGNGTSGGGSSSGGGGGSGTVTQNITANSSKPAEVKVNSSEIYLTKLTINFLNNVQNVGVTVSKVDVTDANLQVGAPSGQSYQAFKVDTAGINDSGIGNVSIEFKVNKTWLAERNGSVENIGLYRKPTGATSWNALTTSFLREDSYYYYFSALSPGFSTFLVMYEQGNKCQPGIQKCFDSKVQSCSQNSTWTLVKECTYGCGNNDSCKIFIDSTKVYIVSGIVGVALVFVVVYFLFKRKR